MPEIELGERVKYENSKHHVSLKIIKPTSFKAELAMYYTTDGSTPIVGARGESIWAKHTKCVA